MLIGPEHPYISGGLPMDAGGVGHGVADLFGYQARAFLDQIAGIGDLGPLPGFEAGLHGLRLVAAITESAATGAPPSKSVTERGIPIMKLGVYTAILHDKPLRELWRPSRLWG